MPNLLTKQAEVQTLGSVVTVARLLRLDLVAANVRESSVQPLTPPGSRMQAALQGLESGHYKSVSAAATALMQCMSLFSLAHFPLLNVTISRWLVRLSVTIGWGLARPAKKLTPRNRF
jgi:hypothetical protein